MLFSGCSNNVDVKNGTENAVVFTDDLGRTVTVDSPQRVAAFLGSFAEIWYLAGGEIIAAPDDAWEDFDLPLSDETVNLGKINDLSLEMLFSAAPDFVIASSNIRVDLEWLDTLEDTEITVAYFDVSNFEDYLRMLKICTEITGRDALLSVMLFSVIFSAAAGVCTFMTVSAALAVLAMVMSLMSVGICTFVAFFPIGIELFKQ